MSSTTLALALATPKHPSTFTHSREHHLRSSKSSSVQRSHHCLLLGVLCFVFTSVKTSGKHQPGSPCTVLRLRFTLWTGTNAHHRQATRFSSLMRPRSSLQKSLKNTVRDFQTARTTKPSQGQATIFAHPTPFSTRVQKLASKPFRRSYNENHFHSQASYASAKTAVRSLLVLNTGVFGAWWWASNSRDAKLLRWLDENVTLSERNLAAGRYHTLITNAFSHVGLPHFAFSE